MTARLISDLYRHSGQRQIFQSKDPFQKNSRQSLSETIKDKNKLNISLLKL